MPIYEYRCVRCATEAAYLVRRAEPGPSRCQHCGEGELERMVSAFNVVGGRPPSDRSLRYGSRDFLERPERFGEAMRAVEARTGVKLASDQVDGAMHRLSEAKKAN